MEDWEEKAIPLLGPPEESKRPWLALLEHWPLEWRERWGIRANELEEVGLGLIEAERQAWNETIEIKAEVTGVPLAAKRTAPAAPTTPPGPARRTGVVPRDRVKRKEIA